MENETIETSAGPINVYRTTNDYAGNPRYVVHYLDLGLPDYVTNAKTRKAKISKYRGRDFGGGYVFSTYDIEAALERILKALHE